MVHPQEPAEGADEDVEAPGVEKAGDPSNPASADEERRAQHPEEPAEGGDDQVDND